MSNEFYIILTISIIFAMAIILNLHIPANQDVVINICPLHRPQRTQLFLATIINKVKIQIMGLNLNKKDFVDTLLSLKDSVTGNPVEGAMFSEITLTSSDESIFTANTDVNNDGQVDVVGVAPGEATLNVSAKVDYTNSNGEAVSETKTASVPVTVSQPPADGTELVVSFTPPQTS